MSTAVAIKPQNTGVEALSVQDLVGQVSLIQNVMQSVMKDKEHYGTIPGCGDKPALLKPGAEKLGFVFRLAPEYHVIEKMMERGHKEYQVTCSLKSINTGNFVGQGVGSCSTMESKYRFRPGPVEFTGKPVPRSYWDDRKSSPAKAQEMIGGKGFSVKKNDAGVWEIVKAGEKVEHDNPADYYNTVLKMAKKRAHVDAVLTATAASDIFTQDVEDLAENSAAHKGEIHTEEAPSKSTVSYVKETRPTEPPTIDVDPIPQGESDPNWDTATPEQPQSQSSAWKDATIHFGKQKGIRLGDLKPDSLKWWITQWEPTEWPTGSGKFKDIDLALRRALNEAEKEAA